MKTDDYKTFFDKFLKQKPILKIWGIILILIFIAINIISGLSILNPKPKNISLVNFYNENIILNIEDEKIILKPLEAYTKSIRTTRPIVVNASKESSNENIFNLATDFLGLKQKLIIIALSENKEYCFFKQNVTRYYYDTNNISFIGLERPALYNLRESLILDTNDSNAAYIFPGQTQVSNISKEFGKESLIGVYPILCSELENLDAQDQIIKAFINYNSEDQLRYLEEKVFRINQSGSLTELETIEY